MDTAELGAWLRLTQSASLRAEAARRLLAAFGSPVAIFESSAAAWRTVVDDGSVESLQHPPEGWTAGVERTQQWLAADPLQHHVFALGDPAYPPAWLNIATPPLLMFAVGRLDLLKERSLAVVGSRNATPQGLANARAFSAHLGRAGLTIVSGLALGIDGAAHEGALDAQAGTIAVVGTGLDLVYPSRHLDLARRIAERGLIVSEYRLGTPSMSENFPRRNRLIAGLALGTLVVEAARKSGSLITARMASDGGREVFAIPGSIHSPQSRGCHWLIKQGAKLVETADDILEELHLASPLATTASTPGKGAAAMADPPATNEVLDALGHDPASLDALGARTGLPTSELSARLLELELDGLVARLPGGLFQRIALA